MLVDPLTGVPDGLLTILTVNGLLTPEKDHYNKSGLYPNKQAKCYIKQTAITCVIIRYTI